MFLTSLDKYYSKVQHKFYFKSLCLENDSLRELSKILFKSLLLRIRSVRDISQFFEIHHGIYLNSRDKFALALNIRLIHSSFFKTVAVTHKKFASSYNYSFLNLYIHCLVNLFTISFLPMLKARVNRFSIVFDSQFCLDYIDNTINCLTLYDSFLKNCFQFKFEYVFSSQTKLWLLKTIPFQSNYLENLFFFFEFFNLLDYPIVRNKFPESELSLNLFNYALVDLVRESSVLAFMYSLLYLNLNKGQKHGILF